MNTKTDFYEKLIADTMDFVELNCEKNLSLELLAERAELSSFHFHRLFRAIAQQSLGQFIRHVRLQKGARLLRSSKVKVVMIALECGYQSHEAFSRSFHSLFGISPTEFRQQHKDGKPVTVPDAQIFERSGEGMIGTVELKQLQSLWIAYKRYIGPYSELHSSFADFSLICAMADGNLLQYQSIGIAYDDPDLRPSNQLRFDAGIVIDSPEQCPETLSARRIFACQCATVTIKGCYANLINGYDRLYRQGTKLVGDTNLDLPPILFYRKAPPEVPLDDALTEIYLPLKRLKTTK